MSATHHQRHAVLRDQAESPIAAVRHHATLQLIAEAHYMAYSDARHAAQVALKGAHSAPLEVDLVDVYHDAYRSSFPRGGDEGDHDEAIREGVHAVMQAVASQLTAAAAP